VQEPRIIQSPAPRVYNSKFEEGHDLEELIQKTILKVAQRHSDAADSKERLSNASSNNTVIRTSFGISK
jgi:hypothetical protein